MATTRFYLDTRRRRRDGTCHLKLMLNKDSHTALVGLSVFLLPEHWDSTTCRVIGRSDRVFLNTYITHRKQEVDEVLLRLLMEHRLNRYNVYELKEIVEDTLTPESERTDTHLFLPHFNRLAETRTSGNTRYVYNAVLRHLQAYCGTALDTLTFEDITVPWLTDFDLYLRHKGMSQNTRAMYLSKLRAVFTSARDADILVKDPFRRFRVKTQETRKRSLTVDELRDIIHRPLTGKRAECRDLFLLSFMLCGINSVDMYNLREVVNGRIEYRRAKTGKLYSIKVEPEAQAIIARYKGRRSLLSTCERFRTASSFNSHLDFHLHALRPHLSTYWARHTWATIAASLDIPKETIAGALGHNIGSPVTSIYIRFDERKIDEANRRVIDYVLGK